MPTIAADLDGIVEAWLPAVLGADATLAAALGTNTETGAVQIYEAKAPRYGVPGEGAGGAPPPPYVTFYCQSGGNTPLHAIRQGDGRIAGSALWYVGTTVRADNLAVGQTVAARLAWLLNGAVAQTTATGRVIGVLQTQTLLDWEETEDGVLWHHRGALYRILTETL